MYGLGAGFVAESLGFELVCCRSITMTKYVCTRFVRVRLLFEFLGLRS